MDTTTPPPRYSVIVPAYNAAKTILPCLHALQNQTIDSAQYEVILINDSSTDETGRLATESGVKVINMPKNRGQAAGRNVGIEQAQGQIICCTDADCTPQADWLAELTAPLLANDKIAASKGVYTTQQRQITARFVQLEYENKYDRLRQHPYITFVDTYSAAYQREVLLDVGGFDERFPVAEDRELSYRIAAAGHKMVFQDTAVVSHIHAHTIKSYFHKKMLNGYWAGQAVGHFPERRREDSYTPQMMKVQIGLMGLILTVTTFGLLFPPLLLLSFLLILAFLITTLPFVKKGWSKDKNAAICSPFYLALRALALGLGYAWRLVKPIPQVIDVKRER